MRSDVITRLAAANPVPGAVPLRAPAPLRNRRLALAAVAAVVVAIPATAFGGRLGDLLGISNQGTPVASNAVLPGQSNLDRAMQELKVGSTMQLLGRLNGVDFYAARNADGHFCLAIDHVDTAYEKGFGCDLNTDGFPSAQRQALSFPPALRLQGIAADGVAKVAYLDSDGTVIDTTPVVDNLFASSVRLSPGQAAYIETFDAQGNVTSKRALP
jgi:hypothetical protein